MIGVDFSIQDIISRLQFFWTQYGCSIFQPIDIEVGAGTFHPITCLGSIGPEPISAVYVQPSRRPLDGRYGKNKYRSQLHYQLQVVIKPCPSDLQDKYINSLKALNVDITKNDLRFIKNDWENPTLGAYGTGWEISINGIEVTQLTYFYKMGGIKCDIVTGELAYGIERLAMIIQNKNDIFNLAWDCKNNNIIYGDIFYQNEVEQSKYNFEYLNTKFLSEIFNKYIIETQRLISLNTPLIFPAYENLLKTVHIFNLLDVSKSISNTERQRYILKISNLVKLIVKAYYNFRKLLGFPFCR